MHKLTRFILATAMLSPVVLAAGAVVSEAADAPRPAYRVPPPPPPPMFYNWTGLYAGVHVGGGFADLGGNSGSGLIGGGQIGYNYQVGQYVYGLEAEVSGSSIKNTLFSDAFGDSVKFNWDSMTTLTPRFGWASDNWLIYGKAGGAWANVSASVTAMGFGTFTGAGGTASGFVAGIGAEYAFRNNWSAKIEYNAFDFGSDGAFIGSSATLQTVKVGINYKFGMPGGPGWPF